MFPNCKKYPKPKVMEFATEKMLIPIQLYNFNVINYYTTY